MIDSKTAKAANHIRREMKKSGYTKGVWSAALKTAFRYDKLIEMPEVYEKRIWKFTKKDGTRRDIHGVHSTLVNPTTIRVMDLNEGGAWKSFRVWQLLPHDEQATL